MNPSYQHYATHDESEYPHLWRNVVSAFAPCLGPTGMRLHDHSGRANWGTLTNMTPATRWVVDRGQYTLSFTGTTTGPGTFVKFSGVSLPENSGWSVSWWCWCNTFATTAAFPSVFLLATEDGKGIKGFLNNNHSTWGPVSWGAFDNTWARLRADAPASVSFLQVWRHVVITYNGEGKASSSSYRVYIDGVRYGVVATGAYLSYANVNEWGGNNHVNDAYTFDGYLDDMVVAYSVRSENDAREMFQIGRGGIYTPRRRRRAYFGPLFQAGWARGSNVILQPCGVS